MHSHTRFEGNKSELSSELREQKKNNSEKVRASIQLGTQLGNKSRKFLFTSGILRAIGHIWLIKGVETLCLST